MEAVDRSEAGGAPAFSPLHPNYVWVMRLRQMMSWLVLLVAAAVLDFGLLRETGLPAGAVPSALLLIAVAATFYLPARRYRAWSFLEDEDELHVRHGVWIRVRTIVPFGRVQHLDVTQGPVERRLGLATLVLHTAGTRSAAVPLPGLPHAEAERMRDRVRSKIRQELDWAHA